MKPGARWWADTPDGELDAVPRWSPMWWAAWTASIFRPGRFDDEDPPPGCDGVTPWWDHVAGHREWDRARRPDWTDLRCGQESRDPVPTDLCAVHGRCVGTCVRDTSD